MALLFDPDGEHAPDYRFQVIEVDAVYGDGNVVSARSVREFRTEGGADAYEGRLRADGKTCLRRVGVVTWMTTDEFAERSRGDALSVRGPEGRQTS